MDWDRDTTKSFIEDYRNLPELWNNKLNEYKDSRIRNDRLRLLASKYNCTVSRIKKKIKNLRSAFHRERYKLLSSGKKGKWFAFDLLRFLEDVDLPPKSTSSTAGSDEEDLEDFEEPEDVVESQMTIEDHQPSTSSIKKELTPPHWEEYQPTPENKPKKRKIMEDPWVDEAYKILKSGLTYEKDSSAVFGEYVASKHRQYSAFTKSTVEHLINNILYQADIGKYDKPNSQQP
ncbi:uncharacterized protein [Halyomorpha halys]|uniref:uncharacterized protein isoform X3 n=1 Tax=Halyomorpha halys TaxID=286706 RepID=UPI0034D22D87